MKINEIAYFAQIAQASYESLVAGDTDDILAGKLQTERGGFTETQATQFASNQSVLLQYNEDATVAGATGSSLSLTRAIGSGLAFCPQPGNLPQWPAHSALNSPAPSIT